MRAFALLVLLAALPAQAQRADVPDPDRLRSTVLGYTMTMNVMGQSLEIPSTRTLARAGGTWRIVDQATLPPQMGNARMSDTVFVDAQTLRATRRALDAGPMGRASLTFTDAGVTGTMSQQGQSIPIEQAFDEGTLADGSAFEAYVAALPLRVGFSRTLGVYSPQGGGVRPMRLTVTGEERVTVAAGTFETYVATLAPQDGNAAGTATLHLAKDGPHIVVKSMASMGAAMGGGTTTVELTRYDR
jgi:hypothetical protein